MRCCGQLGGFSYVWSIAGVVASVLRSDPMAKLLIRITGALGVTALAVFFVGLIPFFADPTVGAGITAKAPSYSVNRQFKGDRLPLSSVPSIARRGLSTQEQSSKPRRIPVGCEGSFSPISSPQLAHIVGRCMT
jgi:hypothetical protein